jgi:hypothetical protein
MMNLGKVLDYLRNELRYEHYQILDFLNDTDGKVIDGVNYVMGVKEVLPTEDWRNLSANVITTIF